MIMKRDEDVVEELDHSIERVSVEILTAWLVGGAPSPNLLVKRAQLEAARSTLLVKIREKSNEKG